MKQKKKRQDYLSRFIFFLFGKKWQEEYLEYQQVNVNCCWSPHSFKKVTLVNPNECEHITVGDLHCAWGGTGHCEWEELLISWFREALREAKEKGSEKADISRLFNSDLLAAGMETFRAERVYEHLMASGFEVVHEDEEELILAFWIEKR